MSILTRPSRGIVKQAEPTPDNQFEQSLSNIAHAVVQGRAPGLLDYEVGFQLLDRDQDGYKAVGVFAFKVGKQWLYAPIFYLPSGELKGDELLYLKNQDMFVPMKEEWINMIMGRKPTKLGKPTSRNLAQQGVMTPNFHQLSRGPSKFASVMPEHVKMASWAYDVLPDLAHHAITNPLNDEKYANLLTVPELIKSSGHAGISALANVCSRYPAFHDALNKMYGEDSLDTAVKQASAMQKEADSVLSRPSRKLPSPMDVLEREKQANYSLVRVIRIQHFKGALADSSKDLTASQRKDLMSRGMTIEDKRPDSKTTVVYEREPVKSLKNPSETGLYEVLRNDHEFRKCLVVMAPYSGRTRHRFCTVVDVDSGDWVNTHPTHIWTCKEYNKDEFKKWHDDLPLAKDKLSGEGTKLILSPSVTGSVPFDIESDDGGDFQSHKAHFHCYARKSTAGSLHPTRYPEDPQEPLLRATRDYPTRIILTDRPGRAFKTNGSELICPAGSRILSVSSGCCDGSADAPHFDAGAAPDFYLSLARKGGLKKLALHASGSRISIGEDKARPEHEAVAHLVVHHGLREKQAQDLVDRAKSTNKNVECLIKYADSYPMAAEGTSLSAPTFPEPTRHTDYTFSNRAQVQPSQEWELPIGGQQYDGSRRSEYDPRPEFQHLPMSAGVGGQDEQPEPDQQAVQLATNASQSGAHELFDTAALAAILGATKDTTIIDKGMPDLMKGMDRLGRILFSLHWRPGVFEDRYGADDMPAIEDSLVNQFESLGDVIMKLRQNKIDMDPGELDDDIDNIAKG